ncbi:MAG: hypothetical protein AAF639_00625 [Chloroflexota bacterium]
MSFATLEDCHIVPEGKKNEVALESEVAGERAASEKKLFEETVDVLDETARTAGSIKNGE